MVDSAIVSPARCLPFRLGVMLAGVISALALFCVATPARAADDDIRLSSIGFLPDRAKLATITGGGTTFVLAHDPGATTALAGKLSDVVTDPSTGDAVRIADFSSVTAPGNYYLEVPGVGRSVTFAIGNAVYADQLRSVMLGYYGWRSGLAVSFIHGGQLFRQGPGHLQDGLLDYLGQVGVKRDGTRGWYDAGDFGKYTVNAGFTLGMLLQAWEQFGSALRDLVLPIPEQGGSTPDFLDELAWEYAWLLTMPYGADDGRVSHKLTSLNFPALALMPENDSAPTYYSPYSTSATAVFVAAAAKGSRAFRPYDAAFADRLLAAARTSYAWLQANPADHQADLSGFNTGSYQSSDADDRLWAAAEMWETTGEAAALQDVETRLSNLNPKVTLEFDWDNVANLGVFTYVLSQRADRDKRDAQLVASVQQAILDQAAVALSNRLASGYGRALTSYHWGTNGQVARTCMMLQVAQQIAPNVGFLDSCADQIGHLYGRNLYGRSFVTGEGKNPPLHPHHRPSVGDTVERPFPGLLVGGPQPGPRDWQDVQDNYWTNEVAINWNAALAYALASFAACASGGCNGVPVEICDGLDNNGNGQIDEDGVCSTSSDAGAFPSVDAGTIAPARDDAGVAIVDGASPDMGVAINKDAGISDPGTMADGGTTSHVTDSSIAPTDVASAGGCSVAGGLGAPGWPWIALVLLMLRLQRCRP